MGCFLEVGKGEGGFRAHEHLSEPLCPKDKCRESDSLKKHWDFPGGAVVKNLPASAGDMGSSPGPGRSHMPPWSN